MPLDELPNPPVSDPSIRRLASVKILVVEDDEDLRETLASYLEGVGASVMRAATVAAGRDALAQADLDLLISDIALPDGSGHELAAAARAHGVAALALTGGHGAELALLGGSAGFQMHMNKPCAPDALVGAVELLLRRQD